MTNLGQRDEPVQKGAFFIAFFSKELNERQETYMHGELRLAIDRLRNMPNNRVWFIPVLINPTEIPSHSISDYETLKDINAVMIFENWNTGLTKILKAMRLDDPDYRRVLHLIGLIKYHPAERGYAIEQLANTVPPMSIRAAAAEAIPLLTEALRDAILRRRAVDALGRIGPAAAETVPLLTEALRDADEPVRRRAAEALGQIGPAAIPALTEALRDADEAVRVGAARALGKICLGKIGSAAAEVVPALTEALRDPDRDVRWRAAYSLGLIGPAADKAIPVLTEALRDADEAIRQAAAEAIGKIGPAANTPNGSS
ncbi:MAG TPA: HEAT repeat domain-containing protein [Stellaceae bacterium]|nr:HEAT repeat domain-containing protein [Stellaceae bacterium]